MMQKKAKRKTSGELNLPSFFSSLFLFGFGFMIVKFMNTDSVTYVSPELML